MRCGRVSAIKLIFRGNLPKFIAAFLSSRYFKVKVANTLSEEFEQENGVPQGAVLSVLLFALRINGIAEAMPVPVKRGFDFSLYVDDLQFGYSHPDLKEIDLSCRTLCNTYSIQN